MVAVHWFSNPVEHENSSRGGRTTTGAEWKTSPSFQKTGVPVWASFGRSRCSPSTPFGQDVAFVFRPGAPQPSASRSVRSHPWTKSTIAVAHWFTTDVQALSGADPQMPHSCSCCAHHDVVRFM